MKKRGSVLRLIGLLAGVVFITILFLSEASEDTPKTGNEQINLEENMQIASGREERILDGCTVTQTMRFLRCGHSVTRRLRVPDEIKGQSFSAVQRRYSEWQIEVFLPGSISMSREMALYCPMHWVLSVNEAGEAVLMKNEYGDGMALKKTYGKTLDDFTPEKRDKLLLEIGFDTQQEAEAWLGAD